MEKTISIRNTEITFSIWDLGGQREFVNMLPLVSNDAVAILFMFDLSRKSTLNSVKEWYRQARGFNKVSVMSCNYWEYRCTNAVTTTDCHTHPSRNKIRRICHVWKGGAGRDHQAGSYRRYFDYRDTPH